MKQALAATRERCWRKDWVLEFDIKGLFDYIRHDYLMKLVKKHAKEKWVILYIERWLKAPFQMEDGEIIERKAGTPQGVLCTAMHKPPNVQCLLMFSVNLRAAKNQASRRKE